MKSAKEWIACAWIFGALCLGIAAIVPWGGYELAGYDSTVSGLLWTSVCLNEHCGIAPIFTTWTDPLAILFPISVFVCVSAGAFFAVTGAYATRSAATRPRFVALLGGVAFGFSLLAGLVALPFLATLYFNPAGVGSEMLPWGPACVALGAFLILAGEATLLASSRVKIG